MDVRTVAAKAVETAQPAATERGISIELHPGELVPMVADAGELEIILNNLVSNAVKYNRDGGRVDVALSVADSRVTVAVADTGIGMTPAEAAQLGGEFVRIKNSKTRSDPGQRARPVDRQEARDAVRRRADDRKHPGRRQHLHGDVERRRKSVNGKGQESKGRGQR